MILRDVPRWVLWRAAVNPSGKTTKYPYRPTNPRLLASTTDPKTWDTYAVSSSSARLSGSGLGFVFNGDGLIGIDLDHVVEGDQIAQFALEVVYRIWSYTELSPSGTGLHIICKGQIPYAGRKAQIDAGAVEVYSSGRYLTMTGQSLPWSPTEPQEAQSGLDWLMETYFPTPEAGETTEQGDTVVPDDLVLEIARAASNGDGFIQLYDQGDLSAHGGDHSKADASLMSRLAFYTGRNPEQMERLFTASRLGQRGKWLYRPDYRARTIELACRKTDSTYSGDHSGRNWLEAML